jgi:glutamate--cysteine ligase
MMRQTAALHLNLDLGLAPPVRWRAAARLAPLLTAIFANSPQAEGSPTGHRSTRQRQWRALDPSRTGLPATGVDPCGGDEAIHAEYLAFALEAGAFLLGPEGAPARPFRAWLGTGAGLDDWRRHLTTLFPEVRPRGYLELRSVDALPLRWYGAPLALAVGVLYAPDGPEAAIACLPEPTPDQLDRAGRLGLADADLAAAAGVALDLAEAGLARLAGVERAHDTLCTFRRAFTDRGLDPGHDERAELTD